MASLAGCAPAPADLGTKDEADLGGGGGGGKEDRWDWRSSPERFDGELDYFLEDLPLEGTAERESWPSTYWPTYEDSINVRWQSGQLSPAQKYDQAGTLESWRLTVGTEDGTPAGPVEPSAKRFAGQAGVAIPDDDDGGCSPPRP